MTIETQTTAMTLPDETTFRHDIAQINRFQQVVRATMVSGQDYGIIPGTQKPTLLKPGAEKIAKLLGLSDDYEIIDRQEDWQKGFFRYLIKCQLKHAGSNVLVSSGLGECNSMESKYRWRWVGERDLPAGVDKSKLVAQERRSKAGGHWTVYRFDNEDIYSQVNTILKMAKKRALVDAALSAGRLSEVFTQDVEDLGPMPEQPDNEPVQVESKPAENHTKPAEAQPAAKPATKTTKAAASQYGDSTFEPQVLKTFGDFFQAAHNRFGLSKSETLKKIGKSDTQMGDLREEWEGLKKVMEAEK